MKKKLVYQTSSTVKDIEILFRPKTKNHLWYLENCVGKNELPQKAINGHN